MLDDTRIQFAVMHLIVLKILNSSELLVCLVLFPKYTSVTHKLSRSASLGPTDTVLEAEAIALKEALLQMRRLNYHNVTFCGDSLTLFGYLEKNTHSGLQGMGPQEIQRFLQDIVLVAHDSYRFKYINRQANQQADELARDARIHNSPYVVSWIS